MQRRRRLLATTTFNSYDQPRRRDPLADSPAGASANNPATGASSALRDVARMGMLDDHVIAVFSERWAHLHGETNPSPLRDDGDRDTPAPTLTARTDFNHRRMRPVAHPTEPYTLSNMRSTQRSNSVRVALCFNSAHYC